MIAALAQAAQVLDNAEYAATAARAAAFLLDHMRLADGRLLRTTFSGAQPKLDAYLEDYAFLVDALVALYEATFESRWIEAAAKLADVMVDQFWDESEGGFYYTGKHHETLIARTKDPHDSSIPSGNAKAVTALLRLAKLTGRRDFMDRAERTFKAFRGLMESPRASGQMLIALDFHLGPVQEFALVGDGGAELKKALGVIHKKFRPNKVLAQKPAAGATEALDRLLPLLEGKKALGPVTTYICRDFTCQDPLV